MEWSAAPWMCGNEHPGEEDQDSASAVPRGPGSQMWYSSMAASQRERQLASDLEVDPGLTNPYRAQKKDITSQIPSTLELGSSPPGVTYY